MMGIEAANVQLHGLIQENLRQSNDSKNGCRYDCMKCGGLRVSEHVRIIFTTFFSAVIAGTLPPLHDTMINVTEWLCEKNAV